MVVVLADGLDQQVERARGDDDVVDLGKPISAWRGNPSWSGSVTATIWMTPLLSNR
jgi:hypothetical protein